MDEMDEGGWSGAFPLSPSYPGSEVPYLLLSSCSPLAPMGLKWLSPSSSRGAGALWVVFLSGGVTDFSLRACLRLWHGSALAGDQNH